MIRYGIALVVATLIIALGAAFVNQTQQAVEQPFRKALRDAKAAGTLPAEIDPETAQLRDFGVEVSPELMHRLQIAHLLIQWRYALIAIVVVGCLGIARVLQKKPVDERA